MCARPGCEWGVERYDGRMIRVILMICSLAATTSLHAAWTQNYESAKKQAGESGRPILALFTGTDWCPPCKQFEKQVANSKHFLEFTAKNVVLLKLDFPRHMLQSPALIAQNTALAERIGGEEYPRFYLLDEKGAVLAKLDMQRERMASDYGDFVLQALAEGLAEVRRAAGR